MSENIDELRNMLITLRVSELQMLLGFAGRNKTGRKNELQQRALELLRVRSHPIQQKIRELYKTIQQTTALTAVVAPTLSPNKEISSSGQGNSMPQTPIPSTTSAVHAYNVEATRRMSEKKCLIPDCPNTSTTHPNKIFLTVPTDPLKRTLWRSALEQYCEFPGSRYCCEDHFNLEEDSTNWRYCQVVGKRFVLKPGVVPHLNLGSASEASTSRTTRRQRVCQSDELKSRQQQNALYNQGMYAAAYPQYSQNRPQQNVLANNFPIQPDVKFRRLPFYDILDDLLKPSSLVPQNNQRMQDGTFYFHLTPQQATDVASSRDTRPGVKNDYVKQVQLRFCLLETTCEQEDYFPPNVSVKVNNKPCPLPNPIPTNKQGVEPKRPPRPVNITPMVKLSPTVTNMITVTWAADYGRGYAITVALVHKLTSFDLLQRLKSKGVKHADHTRGLIKEKLRDDGDLEIATTCLRVSLICPLGKMRMSTPCRAITCNHLQCFDASLFLQMNERKPTWTCPVCDKPALYDNLVIDGYFQDVLNSPLLPSDCNEIQLHKDSSWSTPIVENKKVVKTEKTTNDDSIEIIGDDSGDDVEYVTSNNTASSSTDKKNGDAKNATVVDLTLSDSDDDQPLAKRRAVNQTPDSTIKFPETSTVSANSNTSRVSTTPGPVSSSGYPASPSVINLDSSSPPRSPKQNQQQQPSSCMLANMNGTTSQSNSVYAATHMPFLEMENEASANISNYSGVN